jgi:Domain of unknown function (DUF1996)
VSLRAARLIALGLVLVAAACSSGGGDSANDSGSGNDRRPETKLIATAEERGSFSTPCPYSHSATDDPIVHHAMHGMSHRHDFFGATTTGSTSTAKTLLAGGTTCRSVADKTAYWAPSLLAAGKPLRPKEMSAYYRVPVGADATQVEVPPNGLEMIAGNSEATTAQAPAVSSWACGLSEATSPVPLNCERSTFLLLRLTFDPCWDGEHLTSPDHRSHLAPLGDDGSCPDDHPVLIPELHVEIRYPVTPEGTPLSLASGPATGGHGDALVAWDSDHIESEVDVCLRANRKCDVTSETTRLSVPTHPTS